MLRIQKSFKNDWPTIYLVGTPIGNLQDISKRAVEVLLNSQIIYCEDTRVSVKLLKSLKISKKLKSVHKFNEQLMVEEVLSDLKTCRQVSIISDAGVPCISDPGAILIQNILKQDPEINICSVNCGPAYIHAIVASGFTSVKNLFLGFIDKKAIEKELKKYFDLYFETNTIISFYESVHRIQSTLNLMFLLLNENTKILVAREISKINEEYIQGTVKEVVEFINSTEFTQKGEFCVVVEGDFKIKDEIKIDMKKIVFEIETLISQKTSKKDAIKSVAKKYSLNKNNLNKYFYK